MKKNDWYGLSAWIDLSVSIARNLSQIYSGFDEREKRLPQKLLRIMKLTTFLLLFCVIQTFAVTVYSQGTQLTLNLKNSSIEKVLFQIEQQSNFVFLYNRDIVDVGRATDIAMENASIQDVLDQLFTGSGVKYHIVDRQIVLSPEYTGSAQQKMVTGKVTDSGGEHLPGVTVIVKGKTQGTVTDSSGDYSVSSISGDAILVFSFVGMKTQEIPVSGRAVIDVILTEDAIGIEEVVAIGYGTREKGAVTGAISTVGKDFLETRPMTNTLTALQGALPGVTVIRGSGRPGNDNYSVQIRGISSVGGNKPLILIDGIPGDFNLINPADILSVTVLKDAAASIYGSRAADGVVLVTTKRGVKGKPTISYSGNIGVKTPEFLKRMSNTLQLVEMYDEGMKNINGVRVPETVFEKIKTNAEPDPVGWLWLTDPGFYQNTDWTKVVYGNGIQQMHNISITGGGENNLYLFSAGYNSDEGIMKYGRNVSDRYNLRMNYDFRLFDWLNFETRTNFDSRANIEPRNLMLTMNTTPRIWSFVPVHNNKGQLYQFRGWGNPVQHLLEGEAKNNYSKLSTNFKAETRISKELKLVTQMGITLGFGDDFAYSPTFEQYNWEGEVTGLSNNPNHASYSNSKNYYGLYNAYLEYTKTIFEKHRFNVLVGASHEENNYSEQSIKGSNFSSNELFTLNLADKTKVEYIDFTGKESEWSLRSYFTRVSYDYDRKYFMDFTLRMDGSSKFAPKKRWSSVFPAVSLAWNITEEEFLKTTGIINNLKLRGSWGQTGNQELSFGNYDFIPLVSMTGVYPIGLPNVGQTGAVSSIASEVRTWETIETSNIGLDFALLKSKLSGSIDYFSKINNKMLVNEELPALLGGSAPTQNLGKLKTTGWDISLGWHDNKGDFKYSITAMVSDNKNELLELKGNDNYAEGLVKLREGYSLNSYFGYVDDGIIQNESQLTEYKKLENIPAKIDIGDMMYRDVDGDGKITAFGDPASGTKGDMVYLGNMMPRYTYSSTVNLSYKNFDLNIFLQGVGKRQGVRYGDFSAPFRVWWYQPLEYFYGKTWSPERPDAPYPRIIPGGKGSDLLRDWNWGRTSNRRVVNLAYLRVKVLTLAYNLPQPICNKVKMQNIRVYLSGQDLFTFSKGTWGRSFDPEETWERNDEQTYPFTKVISMGIDLKL